MNAQATAMVLVGFKTPLEERRYPIPEPAAGEVLVRLTASGLCFSDVHMWQGEDPRTPLPIILGHEGVGEVAEVGGEVTDVTGKVLRVGDPLFWDRGVVCGRCHYCTVLREPYLCPNRFVYGIHRSCEHPPHLLGSYADYLLLDARTRTFSLVGCDVDPAVLVAAGCSGATAAHCLEVAAPSLGDVVVVQGPGPLGLFLAAMGARAGARDVIVIGGTDARLKLALSLGATCTLNRRATTPEERRTSILELTDGRGADIVYEAVGAAVAVTEGLTLVRHGGAYVSAGFGQPGGSLPLDPFRDVVRKNVRFLGVWVSDTRHARQALDLILSEPDTFAPIISHRFPLSDATQALEAMHRKEALKAVLLPAGEGSR